MHWLIAAAAMLLVALALDWGLLAYAMYVLVGAILLSRKLADIWSGHLTATRQMNVERVKIGQSTAIVIVLENNHWLPVPWLLLEDLLPRRALVYDPPNLQITGRRLQLASFRGRGRKTLAYQLKCNRRGYYQIGPLVAETGDVFGFYRRYRVLSEPSFLLALPTVVPLSGFDIASRRPIGEVRMTHRLFEDPTRIAGVRSYQAGDPLNRVHWRTTARTGVLHSKVYEPSTIAGATLLLDFHERSFDPRHEPVRSELAITAAASIAGAICEMGQQVGLITNGRDAADRIRSEGWSHEQLHSRKLALSAGMLEKSNRLRPLVVPTRRSNTQLRLILETLARVEKSDGLNFAQLIGESASRIPRSASVIAVLTSVTPDTALALGNLRRRGLAVTAIVSVYEENEFAKLAAPLEAEQIDVRQLRDQAFDPHGLPQVPGAVMARLRMTNADYVAIAVSPALIMTLIGSLVFFLVEVLYVGEYEFRLNYVFALFVFATVLIARIAIEMGSERAAMFSLPLGILTFLALVRFVDHGSAFSSVINLALLALIWWCAHKLTWDCTVIDDNQDASGQGLLDRIGDAAAAAAVDARTAPADNELFADGTKAAGEKPAWWRRLLKPGQGAHSPGLWVVYFSMASLPLFGLGQAWIPSSDVPRRRYAFALLAIYVFSALALLVTTSFLGLRRYLRQRQVEMPAPMAVTWVSLGGVLILVIMFIAALIPRPNAEYALSRPPWQARSPGGLSAAPVSVGQDGADESDPEDGVVASDGEAPAGSAVDNQPHDEKSGQSSDDGAGEPSSDQGESQNQQGAGDARSSESAQSDERGASEGERRKQATEPRDQQASDDERRPSEDGPANQSSSEQSSAEQPPAEPSSTEQTPPPSEGSATESEPSQPPDDATKQAASDQPPPTDSGGEASEGPLRAFPVQAPAAFSAMASSMGDLLKFVVYLLLGLAVAYGLWQNWARLLQAAYDILRELRAFLARLFGVRGAEGESEEAAGVAAAPRRRTFAEFRDPFAGGRGRVAPSELVRYTFEAFEAWACDRGRLRSADRTPREFVDAVLPPQTPMFTEARRLAQLYSEAAYAPAPVSPEAAEGLRALWQMMRTSQASARPAARGTSESASRA